MISKGLNVWTEYQASFDPTGSLLLIMLSLSHNGLKFSMLSRPLAIDEGFSILIDSKSTISKHLISNPALLHPWRRKFVGSVYEGKMVFFGTLVFSTIPETTILTKRYLHLYICHRQGLLRTKKNICNSTNCLFKEIRVYR